MPYRPAPIKRQLSGAASILSALLLAGMISIGSRPNTDHLRHVCSVASDSSRRAGAHATLGKSSIYS